MPKLNGLNLLQEDSYIRCRFLVAHAFLLLDNHFFFHVVKYFRKSSPDLFL